MGWTGPAPTATRIGNNRIRCGEGIGHVYLDGTNAATRLCNVRPNDGSHGDSSNGWRYIATWGQVGSWTAPSQLWGSQYQVGCQSGVNENWSSHYRCFGFQSSIGWRHIMGFYR